ncbi:hypothetical protein [Aquimarina rhabdastrellae]
MKKIVQSILSIFSGKDRSKNQRVPLNEGLPHILELTSKQFETYNHAFLINLISENEVVLQLMHGVLIEQIQTEKSEFNFSINLSFDNEKEAEDRFKALDISKEFTYYEFDTIPCYVLNMGNNHTRIQKIVHMILERVYGYSKVAMFEFELYDQGMV